MPLASEEGAKGALVAAISRYRTAFYTVALLSSLLNVLLLAGSIFMMLVYDSVLPSHSMPTLLGLLAMVVVIYVFQGFFELMRQRILSDVGSGLDRQLSAQVQTAMSHSALRRGPMPGDGLMAMRDLDQLRAFLGGTGPSALIDLPWISFFLIVLFALHVWLGVTALIGAIILVFLTFLTDRRTRAPMSKVGQIGSARNGLAEMNLRHVELFDALGMRSRMQGRWSTLNDRYLAATDSMSSTVGIMGGISKIFRMLLQSLILTVGAILVIEGKASGGVIFASSLLAGRALAPVDAAISNWRGFAAARIGWKRLDNLLASLPDRSTSGSTLRKPARELTVKDLAVAPPGTQRVTVTDANFKLVAGDALAIVGASAAGKTSLGRALIGIWQPVRGTVRFDGATLDQWPADASGEFIGYLPQTVELIEGTVAENIARFERDADFDAILAAAASACVHDMIVALPQGYATQVGQDGVQLSAGQRQRIGLARALYKDPFLILLDEPNSNLDAVGEAALEQAVRTVRARGAIIVLIAHRPSALAQVNYLCIMRDGRIEAFGPRDDVLKTMASRAGRPNTHSAGIGDERRDATATTIN